MGGRNAKPIGLHLAEGNPNNLTKEQIAARQASEVKLGKSDLDKLKPPSFVKADELAMKCWKNHLKEYKLAAVQGVDLITSSDIGMFARYCKTQAEYERLLKSYQSIDRIAYDNTELDDYIEGSDEFNLKVKKQLRSMISVDALLRIEAAINKKMDMLIKMEDRLFLNPLAKIKNVPKPKKEEKKSAMQQFMSRRAGGHGT